MYLRQFTKSMGSLVPSEVSAWEAHGDDPQEQRWVWGPGNDWSSIYCLLTTRLDVGQSRPRLAIALAKLRM